MPWKDVTSDRGNACGRVCTWPVAEAETHGPDVRLVHVEHEPYNRTRTHKQRERTHTLTYNRYNSSDSEDEVGTHTQTNAHTHTHTHSQTTHMPDWAR